jgi:division protein CdvB (Snf7/Vps24/ESCRT-III family)
MSVFKTQEAVFRLEVQAQKLRERLELIERRLQDAREAHRAQIAESLTSKDPEERRPAQSIAAWWLA